MKQKTKKVALEGVVSKFEIVEDCMASEKTKAIEASNNIVVEDEDIKVSIESVY